MKKLAMIFILILELFSYVWVRKLQKSRRNLGKEFMKFTQNFGRICCVHFPEEIMENVA